MNPTSSLLPLLRNRFHSIASKQERHAKYITKNVLGCNRPHCFFSSFQKGTYATTSSSSRVMIPSGAPRRRKRTHHNIFRESDSTTHNPSKNPTTSTKHDLESREQGRSHIVTGAPDDLDIVRDSEIFTRAANSFLDRVQNALEPMKASNEVFHILRSKNESGENLTLRLKPSEGQYVFQVDTDVKTLTMISPMSGSYTYVLCAHTGQFVGMDDGHVCEGMLVRDLIRHCQGLPNF